MTFLTQLRKEVMEQIRTRRFLIVFILLLVWGMLSPLTAKFIGEIFRSIPAMEPYAALMPSPSVTEAIGQYVKNVNQFMVLLALLVTMGSIVVEKDKGTAALMLVKPLPRSTFLFAKFLAIEITFGVSLAAAAIADYYYTFYLFQPMKLSSFLALNGFMLLYALIFVAITLLASVLVKSQAAAAGIGFAALLFLSVLSMYPPLKEKLPDQLIQWGGELMAGAHTTYWPALFVGIGIILACLLIAWLVFRKQEL
jgi:ABC-2 type transport system permease protein